MESPKTDLEGLKNWVRSDIPGASQWQKMISITEGWSEDLKFLVKTEAGKPCLLRLSKGISLVQEKEKYACFQALAFNKLPIPKLLESGLCCNGKYTYRIFSWLEGNPMHNELHKQSEAKQYDLGRKAGQVLRQIHQISPRLTVNNWQDYYNEKIDRKIASFKNGNFNFAKADKLLNYIEAHRHLLKGRPTRFQHGDFHIGNMLLTPENNLAVIDFNRLDFGDPWEAFNRITWTASKSKTFAKGQINAYFKDKVPEVFFALMALYIAVNQIGAFAWAADYGAAEVKIHHDQTLEILDWYDDLRRTVPRWYD
ncbi:MAG: phosphotransferase [Bacteroidota bacterium]